MEARIFQVARDNEISDGAKVTFAIYESLYVELRKAPTITQMAKVRGIDRRTLRRHRDELRNAGYMSIDVKSNTREADNSVRNRGCTQGVYRTGSDHNNTNRDTPLIRTILSLEKKASTKAIHRKPIRRTEAIKCAKLSAEHLPPAKWQTLGLIGLWFLRYEEHMGTGYVLSENEKMCDMHNQMALLLKDHPPEIVIEAMELFFTHEYVLRRNWINMVYNSFTSTALFARHLRPLVRRASSQRKGSLGDRPRPKQRIELGVDKGGGRLFRRPIE